MKLFFSELQPKSEISFSIKFPSKPEMGKDLTVSTQSALHVTKVEAQINCINNY